MSFLGLFSFGVFVLSYSDVLAFILLYCITTPYKHVCFLMRDREGMDLTGGRGGEELGTGKGGETVIRINYVRKMCIFNIRGKKKRRHTVEENT